MDLAIDLIYKLIMYGKSLSAGPVGLCTSAYNKGAKPRATLPAIILIHDVFRVPLPEQDTTKKWWVYENATRHTRTRCSDLHCHNSQ